MQKKRFRVGCLVPLGLLIVAVLAFALSDMVRFVVLSMAAIFLYGNPSEADRQQAESVISTITTAHQFTQNSLSQPEKPPVFCWPSSKGLLTSPAVFQIYDIRDRAEQDKVVAAVSAAVASFKGKSVELQFLDHENWISTATSGERGPENLLRRVRITNGKIRDDSRQKLITYPSP